MKEYELNYYPLFNCVAGECKHTCCAGWEMDIDEQSLNRYKNDDSPFCRKLQKGINFKKSSFRMDKLGRCAFLNDKGLCDVIINLGENSLCQVCRDHPRFRSYFDDRVETGLGFCCERATEIILAFQDKIQPILEKDDGEIVELDFIEKSILDFRQKTLDVIQDRSKSINERINNLLTLCNVKVENKDFAKILKVFFNLERLEKGYAKRLKTVKQNGFINTTEDNLTQYAEQFLANGLYRHVSRAEDTMWARARAVSCVFGWWLVNSIFEQEKTKERDDFILIADVVREYSAEVEYSQKNLDKLFALAYMFIHLI